MKQQDKLKESLLRFLHDLFDLMVINWLFLLCSLPVLTVGPAACGLYTVTLKLARQEPVNPLKDFFRGFKENLKPGFLLGLLALVLAAAAAGDFWLTFHLLGWLKGLYTVVAILVAVLGLIVISYAFALQAMFDNPLKVQLLNAFKLAVVAPGKTVCLWLILLIPVAAALLLPPVVLQMLGFLYLVAGISGPVYWASHILRGIFDRVNGAPVVPAPPTSEE